MSSEALTSPRLNAEEPRAGLAVAQTGGGVRDGADHNIDVSTLFGERELEDFVDLAGDDRRGLVLVIKRDVLELTQVALKVHGRRGSDSGVGLSWSRSLVVDACRRCP